MKIMKAHIGFRRSVMSKCVEALRLQRGPVSVIASPLSNCANSLWPQLLRPREPRAQTPGNFP